MAVPSQMRAVLQPIKQYCKEMNIAELALVLGVIAEVLVERYGRDKAKELMQSAVNAM